MLRGTNQLDHKIQIAVLSTRQYSESYRTVGYAIKLITAPDVKTHNDEYLPLRYRTVTTFHPKFFLSQHNSILHPWKGIYLAVPTLTRP